MTFEIEYFHERVRAEIEAWPVNVLADYARLVELHNTARIFGYRTLGPLVAASLSCGPRAVPELGQRAFYCFQIG